MAVDPSQACEGLRGFAPRVARSRPRPRQRRASEQLERQQQAEKNRANKFARIAAQKQPKLLQYFFLLDLWERAGGELGITTPYKKRGDRHRPLPTGPVIRYFQAVATAIWGKAPRAHRIKVIKRQYRRRFKRGCSASPAFRMWAWSSRFWYTSDDGKRREGVRCSRHLHPPRKGGLIPKILLNRPRRSMLRLWPIVDDYI